MSPSLSTSCFELNLQVGEFRQGGVEVGLGLADVAPLLHGPARGLGGRGGPAHVRLAHLLLALGTRREPSCRTETRGVPARLACLGLLAIQLLAGLADLFLDLVSLRGVLRRAAPPCAWSRSSRAFCVSRTRKSRSDSSGSRIRLELGGVPDGQLVLAIEVVLQRLGPLGVALRAGQFGREGCEA